MNVKHLRWNPDENALYGGPADDVIPLGWVSHRGNGVWRAFSIPDCAEQFYVSQDAAQSGLVAHIMELP